MILLASHEKLTRGLTGKGQTCGKCEALLGGYCPPPMTAPWMDDKLGLMSSLFLNRITYS